MKVWLPRQLENGRDARAALEALGGEIIGGSEGGESFYSVEFPGPWFVRLDGDTPVLVGKKKRVEITSARRLRVDGPIRG